MINTHREPVPLRAVPNEASAPEQAPTADERSKRRATSTPQAGRNEPRCRWCQLALDHPQLVEEAHRRHVELGLGARMIVSGMSGSIAGSGVTLPSARALSRHFALHAGGAVSVAPKAHEGDDEGGDALFELRELRAIYRRLKRRLDSVDSSAAHMVDGKVDIFKLGQLVGVANSARQTLESIHRVRGPDAMADAVAKLAIKTFFAQLSRALADEAKAGCLGANAVGSLLRDGLGDLARQAAVDARKSTLATVRGEATPG